METEVKEQKSEVDVYEAAVNVAVAELGDMPPRSNRVAANSIQGRSADGRADLVARMRAASRAQGPPVVREFQRLAGILISRR